MRVVQASPATLTRRQALGLARPRVAPRDQLVNVLEFEAQAKLTLAPEIFKPIAGSDRAAFDRITLRPRLVVPTTDLGAQRLLEMTQRELVDAAAAAGRRTMAAIDRSVVKPNFT
jgi:hypothetical protein